jgi:hypothetical protein
VNTAIEVCVCFDDHVLQQLGVFSKTAPFFTFGRSKNSTKISNIGV